MNRPSINILEVNSQRGFHKPPQVLLDIQVEEQENKLFIRLDSADDCFPEGLVEDLFSSYVQRLTQVAMDRDALTAP
ncbi:hypothetical protein C2W62_14385 [Candidatus Entotheonella serta]|nr:hypothetical protein C2W62_14385 [Candidatus Entotheonella serta]